MSSSAISSLLGSSIAATLLNLALAVVSYVFAGISLYQIGKRRGLRNYGFAWVPIGNMWMINAIGDQYETIRTGKKKQLRWWALGLLSGFVVLYVVTAIVIFALIFRYAPLSGTELDAAQTISLLSSFLVVLVIMLVMMGLLIAGNVLTYISLYRLYRSTKPNCSVVFLVLSIVFNFTMPFFLFACRKYDAPIEYVRDPVSPQTQPPVQQLTAAPQPAPEAQPTEETKPTEQAVPTEETKPVEPTVAEAPESAEETMPAEQAAPAEEATPDDPTSSEQ